MSLLRRRGQPRLHPGRLAPSLGREAGRPGPQHWVRPADLQGRLHQYTGLLLLWAGAGMMAGPASIHI